MVDSFCPLPLRNAILIPDFISVESLEYKIMATVPKNLQKIKDESRNKAIRRLPNEILEIVTESPTWRKSKSESKDSYYGH